MPYCYKSALNCYKSALLLQKCPIECYKSARMMLQKCPRLQKFRTLVTKSSLSCYKSFLFSLQKGPFLWLCFPPPPLSASPNNSVMSKNATEKYVSNYFRFGLFTPPKSQDYDKSISKMYLPDPSFSSS